MGKITPSMAIGLLLGTAFAGLSLYLLFFYRAPSEAIHDDLHHYALLMGSYGLWRVAIVFLQWRNEEKNV
jgi:H+/Cl- antiporter ClcA